MVQVLFQVSAEPAAKETALTFLAVGPAVLVVVVLIFDLLVNLHTSVEGGAVT
jgi:hypothetical protein